MFWGRQINFHLLMSDFGFKWYQGKWSEEIEEILCCIMCPKMKCFGSFRRWMWYCFWGNVRRDAQQVKLCNCSHALITCSTKVLLFSENMIIHTFLFFFHFTGCDLIRSQKIQWIRNTQIMLKGISTSQHCSCDLSHANNAKWDK